MAQSEKSEKLGPFAFINSLTDNKDYMFSDETEKEYSSFFVNRAMSNYADCLFLANEMNRYSMIPAKANHDFYFYGVTKKRRFSTWGKKDNSEDIQLIMDEYQYSRQKAENAINILSQEQLTTLRNRYGGRTK